MEKSKPTITFYQVRTPQEKIERLIGAARTYFEKKAALLILTDSSKATAYLDRILWAHPIDSFLPHGKGELIEISESLDNYEGSSIFNLTAHPISSVTLRNVYELEDMTSEEKATSAKIRYQKYSEIGCRIVSL